MVNKKCIFLFWKNGNVPDYYIDHSFDVETKKTNDEDKTMNQDEKLEEKQEKELDEEKEKVYLL